MIPTFGQKTIESPNLDGTTDIRVEGYYNGLKSVKETTRQDIETTHSTLLSDVIKCLDVLQTTDTPELVILIKKDKYGTPNLIQKTWIVKREQIK